MSGLPILTFHPIFQKRVWGGRRLAELYGKALPPGEPIGESWEITDRPGAASVVAEGPLAGRDLRWLMENHRAELLGEARDIGGRFPILAKLLDAQDSLSIQVHPPAALAARLKGEPKAEAWLFAATKPGAEIIAGLRVGTTHADFEQRLRAGTVSESVHRIPVRAGDAMFLPSGRLHALCAGSVLFEIQQNSDTTYRVFDWNRAGLDGQPRELHIEPALAAIDFNDHEPQLVSSQFAGPADCRTRALIPAGAPFGLEETRLNARSTVQFELRVPLIVGVVDGTLAVRGGGHEKILVAGQFGLVPACIGQVCIEAATPTTFITATAN